MTFIGLLFEPFFKLFSNFSPYTNFFHFSVLVLLIIAICSMAFSILFK